MARYLLQDFLSHRHEPDQPGQPSLTPREREILRLLAEGYSNNEIAERLVVSPSTIHSHQSNLMKKLNLNSRHELIRYARQRGLLPDVD
jgi:two-component system response regulator NreC